MSDIKEELKDYVYPCDASGFVRGTNYTRRTEIRHENIFYKEEEKLIPAQLHQIFIGVDNLGNVNRKLVPEETEAIFLCNLKDGRQITYFMHSAKINEDIHNPDALDIVLKPFCRLCRSKDERLNVEDFILV